MAFTEFGSGSPQAVKRWASQLMRESFGKMGIRSLIGKGPNACIQMLTDLDKNPGDQIKYDLLVQDRSNGVNGDARLKGFETALTYYQDTLNINQKRHAHSFKRMSQQRSVHDLRRDGRYSLSEWWAWFMEAGIFAHLAGISGDGNETVVGALGGDTGDTDFAGNVITAPDAAHLEATGNALDINDIDTIVAMAKVNNPRIAPLKINGQERYILYLHPYSARALRIGAAAGEWAEIHQRASEAGPNNPIFTGALGVYNQCILRESEFVPSNGDLRNNILLGQGAGTIAFGNAWDSGSNNGGSPFNWKEEEEDYGNEKGVAGVSCLGFKGTQFNSRAFGRIVLRTTDPAP